MSYIDPGTFSFGEYLTGSEMQIVADDLRYLKTATDATSFCGVSVLGSDTHPGLGTWRSVTWDSAAVNVGGWWTSGTDVVVPAGAIPSGAAQVILEINVAARWSVGSSGDRGVQVTKNGTVVESAYSVSAEASISTFQQPGPWWAICSAGDVLNAQTQSDEGSALSVDPITMHVKRIGSL